MILDDDTGAPAPGVELGDGIRLRQAVATGGMAVVYRAVYQESEEVAVKLLPERLYTPRSHRRFLREFQLAHLVRHPNVVETREAGIYEGKVPFLVMEWLEGRTYSEILRTEGTPSLAEAKRVMVSVLEGICAAHAKGVVHRDLKPSNVFKLQDGTVKLIDFGLSKDIFGGGEPLTDPREALGTPSYMSPEQVLGSEVDQRTDIYGAGVLFYELIAGKAAFPYLGGGPQAVLGTVLKSLPPPPTSVVGGLPSQIDEVIMRAMSKSADERYPTATEMRAACLALPE